MAKRDAMTKRAALPRRVTEAASSAGLGAWTSTEEADSAGGASIWFICGIGAPVLAAQVVIPLSVVAAHALSEPGGQWGAWSLIVVSCILSLVALIAAFVLCHVGAGIVRRGRLMLHLHEFGFVLERTKGRVAAARFDETRAERRLTSPVHRLPVTVRLSSIAIPIHDARFSSSLIAAAEISIQPGPISRPGPICA